MGLETINGPLIGIKTPKGLSYNEQVEFIMQNGEKRIGNVIAMNKEISIVQVYKGTYGMNSKGVRTFITGKPLELELSQEMLGRVFDGTGKPIDGLGKINAKVKCSPNNTTTYWNLDQSCMWIPPEVISKTLEANSK